MMQGETHLTAFFVGAALAALVGLFAYVVGYDGDRSFYATVLTVIGALYVLFAVIADVGHRLIPEIGFFGLFAILAVVGFRTNLWIIAGGLALHGVFDFVRHAFLAAPGAPEWWPAFCGSYDVVAALGLATLLLGNRRRADSRVTANQP